MWRKGKDKYRIVDHIVHEPVVEYMCAMAIHQQNVLLTKQISVEQVFKKELNILKRLL